MATGLVHYTVSANDVTVLNNIFASRRTFGASARSAPSGALPTAGLEYPAMVVRNSQGGGLHDLLVFVDGSQPYFVRDVAVGTGQAGTFATTPQKASVG